MPIRPSGPIVNEPIVEVPLVPVTVMVPVAIRLAADKVPENNPFPCTDNREPGVVVPNPALPLTKRVWMEAVDEAWRFPEM